MRLANRSYTHSEVKISEGIGGGSRHTRKHNDSAQRPLVVVATLL